MADTALADLAAAVAADSDVDSDDAVVDVDVVKMRGGRHHPPPHHHHCF